MATDDGIRKRRSVTPATKEKSVLTGGAAAVASENGGEGGSSTAQTMQNTARRSMTDLQLGIGRTTGYERFVIATASLLAILTVAFVVWGFILRLHFHHGKECDMTYSRYKFLPLAMPNYVSGARPYRLLKFVDMRDPRNVHLWNVREARGGANSHDDGAKILHTVDNWCLLPRSDYTADKGMADAPYPNPGHPVLFVPGHWGEYKQARSLGAHGVQFTQRSSGLGYQQMITRGLIDGTINGHPDRAAGEEAFVYDVFTADFDGEGAGLHGSRLVRQAGFVANAIMTIVEACNANSVTLVAHSVGGIVARSVPLLHPETRPYIQNVVTLATPHVALPYAFDESVRKFYDMVHRAEAEQRGELSIVSISGGLRDELIPPDMCSVAHGISLLATEVMPPCKDTEKRVEAALGIDHKAVTWCHNILSVVRKIIYELTIPSVDDAEEEEEEERTSSVVKQIKKMGETDYADMLRSEENFLRDVYGFLPAVALLTTMPYQARELVVFYAIAAAIHPVLAFGLPRISRQRNVMVQTSQMFITVPIISVGVYLCLSFRGWGCFASKLVLAFFATLLYYFTLHVLVPLAAFSREKMFGRKTGREDNIFSVCAMEFRGIICTTALCGLFMYIYHVANDEDIYVNKSAVIALMFSSLVCYIVGTTISLPQYQLSGKAENSFEGGKLSSLKCQLAAFFLPALPFIFAGKMVYALSLVSRGGQQDGALFVQFERQHWGDQDMILPLHDDLVRCTVLVCVPLCTVLLICKHR